MYLDQVRKAVVSRVWECVLETVKYSDNLCAMLSLRERGAQAQRTHPFSRLANEPTGKKVNEPDEWSDAAEDLETAHEVGACLVIGSPYTEQTEGKGCDKQSVGDEGNHVPERECSPGYETQEGEKL